jgi:DNA-binding response OmpR family regulator
VVDLMLPGDDGFAICREVRRDSEVPIIMLTASADETDRILGLELGADDYLGKPFNPRELLARIKAVLRRTRQAPAPAPEEARLVAFGNWRLDRLTRELIDARGERSPLSGADFQLLQVFLAHPEEVLSRDDLYERTRGRPAPPLDRSIDVHVCRLRQRLSEDAQHSPLIRTVRGAGLCAHRARRRPAMNAEGRWGRWRRRLARFLPRTLRGRFVLIMLVGVLSAQLASYTVWTSQVRSSQLEQLDELSRNVAYSVASTMRFFRSLPFEYRHIVLDQLRNMGGTRFFVSVNERRIPVEDIGSGPEKTLVVENFREILTAELNIDDVLVEFSHAETLRVYNNEVLLHDLPPRWGQHSLLMEPLSPPILVVQIALSPDTCFTWRRCCRCPTCSTNTAGSPVSVCWQASWCCSR